MSGARSKIQFDSLKGCYGLLGMMSSLATRYKYASIKSLEKLKILSIKLKTLNI
jgi:hypothetical protein